MVFPPAAFLFMEFVEIPGYADALRREAESRLDAWDDAWPTVCGIVMLPMTLRRIGILRRARNGYFVPCTWDNEIEPHSHARQIAWVCSPEYFTPRSRFDLMRYNWRLVRWRNQICRIPALKFTHAVLEFYESEFFDSPFRHDRNTDEQKVQAPSLGADIVYVADMFARAGYSFTLDQIMDMPMRQLWQFTRIIHKREGITLPNHSSILAADYVATLNRKR